jgi:hypothetical protein
VKHRTKERKGTEELRIEGSPSPIGVSDLLRSLCVKFRSEKAIHTEIAKNAKKQRNGRIHEIEGVIQSEFDLSDLCDLCV